MSVAEKWSEMKYNFSMMPLMSLLWDGSKDLICNTIMVGSDDKRGDDDNGDCNDDDIDVDDCQSQ